jgi:hypothetical protein
LGPLSRALLAAVLAGPAAAQPPDESLLQRGGTFIAPPAQVAPEFVPPIREAASPDPVPAPSRLQARLHLDVPLRRGATRGLGSQGETPGSPTLQLDLRYLLVPDSYWFVQATFFRYLHRSRQQPWNPDYTYSFGYDDWHVGTWGFTYFNYTGTRFEPDRTQRQGRLNAAEGQWAAWFRFAPPEPLDTWLRVGDGDELSCRAGAALTPRYFDLASGSPRHNRTALFGGCRYSRPDGWFAELTLHAYPKSGQQQPWDPDFTYAFGRGDWRPGTFTLQYSNYAGTRFPGRSRLPHAGAAGAGSLTLTYRLDW